MGDINTHTHTYVSKNQAFSCIAVMNYFISLTPQQHLKILLEHHEKAKAMSAWT